MADQALPALVGTPITQRQPVQSGTPTGCGPSWSWPSAWSTSGSCTARHPPGGRTVGACGRVSRGGGPPVPRWCLRWPGADRGRDRPGTTATRIRIGPTSTSRPPALGVGASGRRDVTASATEASTRPPRAPGGGLSVALRAAQGWLGCGWGPGWGHSMALACVVGAGWGGWGP